MDLEVQTDMEVLGPYLPLDVLEIIVNFIQNKEYLKRMSLVCKVLYKIVSKRLWSLVSLKNASALQYIKHLSIQDKQLQLTNF